MVLSDMELTLNGDIIVTGTARNPMSPVGRFHGWIKSMTARVEDPTPTINWTSFQTITLDLIPRELEVFPDGSSLVASQAKIYESSNVQYLLIDQWVDSGADGPQNLVTIGTMDVEYTVPYAMDSLDDQTTAIMYLVKEDRSSQRQELRMRRITPAGEVVFDVSVTEGVVDQPVSGSATLITEERVYAGFRFLSSITDQTADTDVDTDVELIEFDMEGNMNAIDRLDSPLDDRILGLAMGRDGDLFVCGSTLNSDGESETREDIFVAKYLDQTRVEYTTLGSPDVDLCTAIDISSDGRVFITGRWGPEGVVASFDQDLTPLNQRIFNASRELTSPNSIHHYGSTVVISGNTSDLDDPQNRLGWIVRFDQNLDTVDMNP